MNIVPIAFAFDNNLSYPACVCISSLLKNANENTFYDIFIIHSDKEFLDKTDLNRITLFFSNCRISYKTIGDLFDKAFEIRGITTPAYYRLLIPELIPEYDKILYSDVDVIFRSDLSELYLYSDLDGCYFGGVDSLSNENPQLVRYYQKLGISADGIIYSGNLLINSKKILKDNMIPKFKELAQNKYTFQDMDVLNIACRGKIKYLPLEFCVTTYATEYKVKSPNILLKYWNQDEVDRAFSVGIVHFNGQKPWKGGCINFDIWWEDYRKSPFFDETYYFEFFNNMLNEMERLSLCKRIKILLRYFIYGKNHKQ